MVTTVGYIMADFDFLAQPGGVLQIGGHRARISASKAAFFPRGDHAHIQPAERLRMLLQRLRETVPAFGTRRRRRGSRRA